MKPAIAAFAAVAALSATGCATPPAASAQASAPRQCFWTNSVNGFSAVNSDTVNVRVGVKDVYQLELLGPCPDVDWTQSIAIESRGGSNICTGLDATLIVPSTLGPQRCAVRSVRMLTPEEVAATPRGDRP